MQTDIFGRHARLVQSLPVQIHERPADRHVQQRPDHAQRTPAESQCFGRRAVVRVIVRVVASVSVAAAAIVLVAAANAVYWHHRVELGDGQHCAHHNVEWAKSMSK